MPFTESDNALFRSNSTYTRFLSAFAKLYGYNYLRSLIDPLLKSMTSLPEGKSYEIDPSKASEQDIVANQKAVEFVAGTFLEIITSSVPAFPRYVVLLTSVTLVDLLYPQHVPRAMCVYREGRVSTVLVFVHDTSLSIVAATRFGRSRSSLLSVPSSSFGMSLPVRLTSRVSLMIIFQFYFSCYCIAERYRSRNS